MRAAENDTTHDDETTDADPAEYYTGDCHPPARLSVIRESDLVDGSIPEDDRKYRTGAPEPSAGREIDLAEGSTPETSPVQMRPARRFGIAASVLAHLQEDVHVRCETRLGD